MCVGGGIVGLGLGLGIGTGLGLGMKQALQDVVYMKQRSKGGEECFLLIGLKILSSNRSENNVSS